MSSNNKIKVALLFITDVLALYLGLFITLLIRYGGNFYNEFLYFHALPFTTLFIPWLVVFYIAGLYDLRHLRNNLDFLKTLFLCLTINAVIGVLLFYLVPIFGIAPKTNLFIFLVIFTTIEIVWRRWINASLAAIEAPNKVLLVGKNASAKEIVTVIESTPQFGYVIKAWLEDDAPDLFAKIKELTAEHSINVIVVPHHLKQNQKIASILYEFLGNGIEIHDLTHFYELVMGKIPLADLEETWFLENLLVKNPLYEFSKQLVDMVFLLGLTIISIPLIPIIAVLVWFSSPGPIILKQTRVGQSGKTYNHYKFRTMRVLEEKNNAWLDEDHTRITGIGKILRPTHLDELPQIVNLFRGEMSIVGPRPDFIDFYNKLKAEIPYYTIRTITKPGLTGWAQTNFPATTSIEETKERLCYDIYYLKNRSIVLDVLIVLKTIKAVITASGK
jgi:exopolysaccharide biosynthesis polyprenyl glycosylphosphotransferase